MNLEFRSIIENTLKKTSYLILALLAGIYIIHQTGIDQRTLGGSRIYFDVTHFDSIHLILYLVFLYLIHLLWNHNTLRLKISLKNPFLLILTSGFLSVAGFWGVIHLYPFAPDEWAVLFQSQVFQTGQWNAKIPDPLLELGEALAPNFFNYSKQSGSLGFFYLPVHALLFTIFDKSHLGWLLNPLFNLGILYLWLRIHSQLWPDRKDFKNLSLLFLAASPQFIFMAMSYFSMTAHLFFNTLWLTLYLEKKSKFKLWLLPISFLAFGLHNPFVHGLFVFPFLVRWFFSLSGVYHKILLTLYYGLISVFWTAFWSHSNATFGYHAAMFKVPDALMMVHQVCHWIRLVSWSFPLMAPGIVALCILRPRLTPFFKDLITSVTLTLTFYFIFELSQGRGWGYRYAHGILTPLTLLSLMGFYSLPDFSLERFKSILAAASLWVLIAVTPLKIFEIRFEIKPFESANNAINKIPQKYVILSSSDAWYSNDLLRNEPSFTRLPLRLNEKFLSQQKRDELVKSGEAIRLDSEFYKQHQIPLIKPPHSN